MKRILLFAVICAILKVVLTLLPDAMVLSLFCRVPAAAAAFYYGVPLEPETLTFTAKGVTLAVTRACAATDFFALLAAVLVLARPWHLLTAWAITLGVNSLRVIALVPVDALFPKDRMPIIHLMTGVAFFLPVFAFVWYRFFTQRSASHGK